MNMDDNILDMLVARLDRIEHKVDKVMAFRSYMAGVGAVCGFLGAWVLSLVRGY